MSASEPPLGPEPEPTGAFGAGGMGAAGMAGGGDAGPGGWGGEPHTEPYAIAALVWSIVSLAIPIIGTLVALVLATRAADAIRRAGGDRKGEQYVYLSRVIAGAGVAVWTISLVLVLALRSGDSNNSDQVAAPTQPPPTTASIPSTTAITQPLVTTTTRLPVTTTQPRPTVSVVPPPPTPATTAPPATT